MVNSLKYLIFFIATSCLANSHSQNNFLVISDIHLDVNTKHRMQLSPNHQDIRNDLDLRTYTSFLGLIKKSIDKKIVDKPDFVLLLGDLQGHKRYKNDVTNSQAIIFKTSSQTFKNTPVIYIFGNNDSPQRNYGKFHDNNISPYLIAKNSSGWKNGFLSTGTYCDSRNIYPCIVTENKEDGYFTIKIHQKLNLIGVNSVIFSLKNSFKSEADAELMWLDQQLAKAKKGNETSIIAMHIPPGRNIYNNQAFWRKSALKKFINIINKYPNDIIGIVTSHTHQEEIKILKTASANIGIYSAPSLSTAYGNAPMFKSFLLNNQKKCWKITNYITYKIAPKNQTTTAFKIYDFQSFYSKTKVYDINKHLNTVTISKIKQYLSGKNPNHAGIVKSPQNIYIETP